YFAVANRYEVQVTFTEPRSTSACCELLRAPGVLHAEPYRAVAARLRAEHFEERAAVIGQPLDARLSRMVDTDWDPVGPPPGGLVLLRDVGDRLRVSAGDVLEVEVTEGRRPVL